MGKFCCSCNVPVFKFHRWNTTIHHAFNWSPFWKRWGDEYIVDVIQIGRDLSLPFAWRNILGSLHWLDSILVGVYFFDIFQRTFFLLIAFNCNDFSLFFHCELAKVWISRRPPYWYWYLEVLLGPRCCGWFREFSCLWCGILWNLLGGIYRPEEWLSEFLRHCLKPWAFFH